MKLTSVVLVLCASTAWHASFAPSHAALLIAHTSFEEPFVPLHPNTPNQSQPLYTDPGNAAVDHALVNVHDYPNMPVSYTSVGGELGFSTFWRNTRGLAGLTDGGITGVLHWAPAFLLPTGILGPIDGAKYYAISSPEGKVTVTMDSVDLTGQANAQVSVDYYLRSRPWPADTYAHIWLEIDDGNSINEITLLDTRPADIDTLNIENRWINLSSALPSNTIATLKFEMDGGRRGCRKQPIWRRQHPLYGGSGTGQPAADCGGAWCGGSLSLSLCSSGIKGDILLIQKSECPHF